MLLQRNQFPKTATMPTSNSFCSTYHAESTLWSGHYCTPHPQMECTHLPLSRMSACAVLGACDFTNGGTTPICHCCDIRRAHSTPRWRALRAPALSLEPKIPRQYKKNTISIIGAQGTRVGLCTDPLPCAVATAANGADSVGNLQLPR